MTPTYIHLESIRSTNTYLAQNAEGAVHGTVVYADCQTAGRGQRGNSWESADFKNITMSMLLRPANVKPSCQFWLSEAPSLLRLALPLKKKFPLPCIWISITGRLLFMMDILPI